MIGLALCRPHAQGEERVNEGQRVASCRTAPARRVHLFGQCGSHTLEPFGFGFNNTLQPGGGVFIRVLARLCATKSSRR